MEQYQLQLGPVRKVYGVAELNAHIRALLDESFGDVWVSGEISGVRLASSGHYYFTLKDGDSQMRCACFRMNARYLKFKPQDGVAVIARGRIDVYEARGEYQLLVEHLEPQGRGALQFAFEQLKTKLSAEGLFDTERKRKIPALPQRIGIVTSPQGAVIQDMLNVLSRRFPGLWIQIYPAQVQGEGSVEQVVRALRYFSQSEWAQVVIVARGGGSLEDLWTFNEEAVARAIAACNVPVVCAVGHETDFTIADFVADLRAPTPSAAAELVICTRQEIEESIEGSRRRLVQQIRYRLSINARRLHEQGIDRAVAHLHRRIGRNVQRVDDLQRYLADAARRALRTRADILRTLAERLRHTDLRLQFAETRQRLAALGGRLELAANGSVQRRREQLQRLSPPVEVLRSLLREARNSVDALNTKLPIEVRRDLDTRWQRLRLCEAGLEQLSPLRVLERGYAIVRTPQNGHVLRSIAEASPGTAVSIRLRDGELPAVITDSQGTL